MTEYALPYRVITAAEAEARRKDPAWYRCHTFGEGWGWRRGDGAHVLCHQCPDFEMLSEADKEAVWQKVKAADDARLAEMRSRPLHLRTFADYQMPIVRATLAGLESIRDIVAVHPMQEKQP